MCKACSIIFRDDLPLDVALGEMVKAATIAISLVDLQGVMAEYNIALSLDDLHNIQSTK